MRDPHPMQPVVMDPHGVLRFRDNAIVRLAVDDLASLVAAEGPRRGKLDLDKIAAMTFSSEDRAQFERLAGLRPGTDARENAIVRHVVDHAAKMVSTNTFHAGRLDLNQLAVMKFSQEDREQFAQLMGYSISGYHELSYVSDESAAEASRLADEVSPGAGGCRDAGCPIHGGPLDDDAAGDDGEELS